LIKKYLRIDFNKNTKLKYYLINIAKLSLPDALYRVRLNSKLNNIDDSKYVDQRVNYYNKCNESFNMSGDAVTIKEFKKEKKKTYFFDLMEYLRYFKQTFKIYYLFGDIITVPDSPCILKSRPITGDNQNAVIMKLNKIRHFIFVDDKVSFKSKNDMLVWRGKAYKDHRITFLKQFHENPLCNVGQTNTKYDMTVPWQKPKMSLAKQLQYKFILCIEGNDVASNLKWVMSSNSIAFMVKPTYETWFMEGTLVPNHHYVLLKDDYSDLEEKIEYYSTHIDEALTIVKNANDYVTQFKDKKREDLISLLVLKKYFEKSGQL